ncbi:type I-C CRISPR-associated protein Cas5 [Proteiniclasticum sp. BAD-10]|uniref:pre-crRNA processing endonuclease n=1 Tax=Proteiniclasticum sediminis TaxID=2804028 RepID=A0A941CS55_9CLOT|nr:type I-C CRISPR-associated protein Cas5c [Proteiniclasticum sediminis]MBR0577134.1 type I-C CRISPR-associated protein Cas5 [Proteiniclasticum sediminis]
MRNQIEFVVYGRYALFTDPLTRVGGEKCSYQIPTYQALKGICESIYWKPTFNWVIDSIRVINPIRLQSQGIRPIGYNGGNSLSYYTYLVEPKYEVRAHFEWNLFRDDLSFDRNEGKHHSIAVRMLEKGGRRDIFLGTRECQGYVEPTKYGDATSYYQGQEEMAFGLLYHSFIYPSESGQSELLATFSAPIMRHGEIVYDDKIEDLPKRFVRNYAYEKIMTSGLQEFEEGGWI